MVDDLSPHPPRAGLAGLRRRLDPDLLHHPARAVRVDPALQRGPRGALGRRHAPVERGQGRAGERHRADHAGARLRLPVRRAPDGPHPSWAFVITDLTEERMLTRRSVLRLAGLLPLAMTPGRVAAQTPVVQASGDAEWRKVVDAARKEGKVVMYSGAVGNTVSPKIAAAFEAKYGIRMEVLEARASELRERIRTEQAAGKVLGDVSHNGSTTTQLQLTEGVFVPYGMLPNAGRPVAPFRADGTRVPIYVIAYDILVNTEMVKPAEEPKSWKDLLDPRWKGKILADDMRALGGGAVFFMVTYQTFGRGFHDKLAEQKPHMNRELRGNHRRVA